MDGRSLEEVQQKMIVHVLILKLFLEIPLICGPQKCGKNTIIQTKIILPEHYQI